MNIFTRFLALTFCFFVFSPSIIFAEPATLKWNPVPGAVEYVVEIKDGTAYRLLAKVTETEYVTFVPNDKKPYCYRVRATNGVITSGFLRTLCITENLSAPALAMK